MAYNRELKREVPQGGKVAIPLKYTRQSSYNEHIRQLIRSEELARAAHAAGVETFEEANDFDVGEDVEFGPGHERIDDPIDDEVIRRLTEDEYALKVDTLYNQLKELRDGKSKSNKRRSGVDDKRSTRSREVDEGEPVEAVKPSNKGSVRKSNRDDTGVEE